LTTWFLPVLVCAAVDWIAVARGNKRLEYVTKPLTLGLLIVAALAIGPSGLSGLRFLALIAALIFSLAGDVFLMLPKDRFVPGLASFLLAHVAYIVVFAPDASWSFGWVVPAVALLAICLRNGTRIVKGLDASGLGHLRLPVIAYMVVITTMFLTVIATDEWWPAVGAGLFFWSDNMIGWSRFVKPLRWAPVAIMVTYHLGQIGLVVGALQVL
jgi:uncharacterized membrane protein YhhN